MLIDFKNGLVLLHQPYFYHRLQHWGRIVFNYNPLSMPAIRQEIDAELTARAAHRTAPVITWSWLVGGSVWSPPYDDIYHAINAAGLTSHSAVTQAQQDAAMCLGLVFMDCAIHHHDWWGSDHCELRGEPITARTYWHMPKPPPPSALRHYP